MEVFTELFQTIIHIDQYLPLIAQYGNWLYLVLFVTAFLETGLILLSIVPSNSLLFGAGFLAAQGTLDIIWLVLLVCLATVLADSINYLLGKKAGRRLLIGRLPFTKQEHLERTELFFRKHGKFAVVVARFIPVVRPLTPVAAGVALMPYEKFLFYNLIGAIIWAGAFIFGGFFFGNVPIVRMNLHLVMLAVVIIPTLPLFFSFLGKRRKIDSEGK